MVLDFDGLGGDGGRLAGEGSATIFTSSSPQSTKGSDSRSRAAERPLCENSLSAVEPETSASFSPHEVCAFYLFLNFFQRHLRKVLRG